MDPRRSWALSDLALSRSQLAAGGPSNPSAARIRSEWNGQVADTFSPSYRSSPCKKRHQQRQCGLAPLAENGVERDPPVTPRRAADRRRNQPTTLESLARRIIAAHYASPRTSGLADAADLGQSPWTPHPRDRPLVVCPWHYAVVHPIGRFVAEHGRVHAADSGQTWIGGSTPGNARSNHLLVGRGCPWLEPGSYTV